MTDLIVLNDGTDEAAWLLARRSVITATQAAAIAGSHPYTKLIDVWNAQTDPDYDPEGERNRWLDERAANGKAREPEILLWAADAFPLSGTGSAPWTPNRRLLSRVGDPTAGATPDGIRQLPDGRLELIECKTTEQKWDEKGLPDHVIDQCLWQMHVTGAARVCVAVEIVKWTKGVATILRTWTDVVYPWPQRLAFLQAKVAEFLTMKAEGIAPESDIRLGEPIEVGYDDDLAEIAAWEQERARAAEILDELAEVAAALAPLAERDKALRAEIKTIASGYAGRRVHLIGGRMIAKLIRGTRTVVDDSLIPDAQRRTATSWRESETLRIEPNPEYIPLTNGENA